MSETKEPLWKRRMREREVGVSSQVATGALILPSGTPVRLKSGSQGWIRARIVEYYDVIPTVGGVMYGGGMTPGYKVHILEGKHKGETIRVPTNYVERI